MALASQRTVTTATGNQFGAESGEGETRLNIAVVFTTVESTLVALRAAGALANRLGAHVKLLVPQVVPYPLPLERPPVSVAWNRRHFQVIAEQIPIETTVHLCLCRDRAETLLQTLSAHSMVVLGGPKRWWPTQETKLARVLRRSGHEVILVETN